jgi:hypothetical protein
VQSCTWLRINKLALGYTKVAEWLASRKNREVSNRDKITGLAYLVAYTLHILACSWFWLGSRYRVWPWLNWHCMMNVCDGVLMGCRCGFLPPQ